MVIKIIVVGFMILTLHVKTEDETKITRLVVVVCFYVFGHVLHEQNKGKQFLAMPRC